MLQNALSSILNKMTETATVPMRIWDAWRDLPSKMPKVNRAYNRVRRELGEIGLLAEGVGLDEIEVVVALLPSMGEAGYVFDDSLPWWAALSGFEPGVIYLPSDLPFEAYVPGGTMVDVIRHEYAHAWRWLTPDFFEQEWFVKAFGSTYSDAVYSGKNAWDEKHSRRKAYQNSLQRCQSKEAREKFTARELAMDFVSEYGSNHPYEDFAETFRHYLRYRNSLDRFKARTGVFKKLKAVERAINMTRRKLGL